MTEGYMDAIKSAILTHIASADSELIAEENVLGSWQENMWNYEDLPVVTVRVGPSTDHEVAHGRKIVHNKNGIYVSWFFTAHVFEEIDDSGDASTSAMQLAEKIRQKLLESDDPSSSGIAYYDRITMREAPTGMERVARIILEGYVFVRRPFTS